jgi:hypothetical protein
MAINYTTLLGLAQPVTGTEDGTWGTVVNTEITALVEEAIAGGELIDVSGGNVTLTTTQGAANQARNAILVITGTPGVSRNIVAPSQSKAYIVINGSDGDVVIKGSATTGATVVSGENAIVAWDGLDFVRLGSPDLVSGPASSTDNAIARFDSTTGKIIQNSGVTIDDSNVMTGGSISAMNYSGGTISTSRINPRVVAASGTNGTFTINSDTTDLFTALGLTGSVLFAAPSGTPVNGQKLLIRIRDDNTGTRALTWTTTSGGFRVVGTTLPSSTVLNRITYVGCIYNSTDVFWDVVAVTTQA